tara:strand:- start:10081 stop:10557 length:477 start_codon:yes stop_codon:yes gene_type:complete
MDTLSHALWGKGLFGYRKYRYYSFLFGALPDLFSFGIYFIYSIFFTSSPIMGRPTRSEIPEWVYSLYDISHSLVIASLFIFIAYKINKEFAFPMLAWPAHIILDFFTHSIEFFPTPILWPISDFKFDGIPWSNPIVFFANVLVIFLLFIYRWKRAKKN